MLANGIDKSVNRREGYFEHSQYILDAEKYLVIFCDGFC
jgi:hypothetical protein